MLLEFTKKTTGFFPNKPKKPYFQPTMAVIGVEVSIVGWKYGFLGFFRKKTHGFFGKFKKHLWYFWFFFEILRGLASFYTTNCSGSHTQTWWTLHHQLWQQFTKKGKRVCQHLFQQLGGIQIRHWEHLLFFMSRPACGCFILLQPFPTLPSGRDVKTWGYFELCLGVCICLAGLLVSCLLMTFMTNQTQGDQQTTSKL